MRRTRNPVLPQGNREFESHPLRHDNFLSERPTCLKVCGFCPIGAVTNKTARKGGFVMSCCAACPLLDPPLYPKGMRPVPVPFGPESAKDMINQLLLMVDETSKQMARSVWAALTAFLAEHGFEVVMVILVTFIVLALVAYITGYWAPLGSFLYHFLYFGTLFIVALIWGPEVFVNDVFSAACTILLYPACFRATGVLLRQIGVRRVYARW